MPNSWIESLKYSNKTCRYDMYKYGKRDESNKKYLFIKVINEQCIKKCSNCFFYWTMLKSLTFKYSCEIFHILFYALRKITCHSHFKIHCQLLLYILSTLTYTMSCIQISCFENIRLN